MKTILSIVSVASWTPWAVLTLFCVSWLQKVVKMTVSLCSPLQYLPHKAQRFGQVPHQNWQSARTDPKLVNIKWTSFYYRMYLSKWWMKQKKKHYDLTWAFKKYLNSLFLTFCNVFICKECFIYLNIELLSHFCCFLSSSVFIVYYIYTHLYYVLYKYLLLNCHSCAVN